MQRGRAGARRQNGLLARLFALALLEALDPPGHAMFWYLGTLWAMISLLGRQRPQSLLPGFLFGIGIGGVAYVGVMPHLSGYAELGLMLFCATAGHNF